MDIFYFLKLNYVFHEWVLYSETHFVIDSWVFELFKTQLELCLPSVESRGTLCHEHCFIGLIGNVQRKDLTWQTQKSMFEMSAIKASKTMKLINLLQ